MGEADNVMRDATGRPRPEVDELLVCPTIAGNQLYNVVGDMKACQEARLALQRALDKGRIGIDGFVKANRGIAREEFLKKCLIKKISTGMGLEDKTS